jgi:hypothetical protein
LGADNGILETLNELKNSSDVINGLLGTKENAFDVLPISKGGTGLTSNSKIKINLGSNDEVNLF